MVVAVKEGLRMMLRSAVSVVVEEQGRSYPQRGRGWSGLSTPWWAMCRVLSGFGEVQELRWSDVAR